jgi:hypothetical protein
MKILQLNKRNSITSRNQEDSEGETPAITSDSSKLNGFLNKKVITEEEEIVIMTR